CYASHPAPWAPCIRLISRSRLVFLCKPFGCPQPLFKGGCSGFIFVFNLQSPDFQSSLTGPYLQRINRDNLPGFAASFHWPGFPDDDLLAIQTGKGTGVGVGDATDQVIDLCGTLMPVDPAILRFPAAAVVTSCQVHSNTLCCAGYQLRPGTTDHSHCSICHLVEDIQGCVGK